MTPTAPSASADATGQATEQAPRRRGRPGYDLESVLRAAVEVFNERGYDGASMEDLSRRLGIAKSGIYHHVSGKEELLRMALDRALDGLWEAAEHAQSMDAPAIARLEALVRDAVAVLESPAAVRHAAAAGARQHRGGAGRAGAAPRVRRPGRQPGRRGGAGRRHPGGHRPEARPRGCCSARSTRSSSGTGRGCRRAAAPGSLSLADAVCAVTFDGLRVRR